MGGSKDDHIVVLCTAPSGEGEKLGRILVEKKLAACVNIIKGIRSLYWWKGEIQDDSEELLIIKTSKTKYLELENTIKEIHPYTVPEIISLPIILGNPSYLAWIDESLS